MSKETINEAIDPVSVAIAAGIAAYAGHKLYKKYKRKNTLEKFNVKEEPKKEPVSDEEETMRDMAYYNAVDLPLSMSYNTSARGK